MHSCSVVEGDLCDLQLGLESNLMTVWVSAMIIAVILKHHHLRLLIFHSLCCLYFKFFLSFVVPCFCFSEGPTWLQIWSSSWSGQLPSSVKSTMTQEGQALPSPTPPENPVEPNTNAATATADPPAETHKTDEDKLEAGAKDELEERKEEEEIREGDEGAQGETHREEEGSAEVKDEGGEELKEERVGSTGDEHQRTEGEAEGETEGTRGEGCINVEVSSAGEEASHEAEEMKEEEEPKENEEMKPFTEEEGTNSQQAGRLVYTIIFTLHKINVAINRVNNLCPTVTHHMSC